MISGNMQTWKQTGVNLWEALTHYTSSRESNAADVQQMQNELDKAASMAGQEITLQPDTNGAGWIIKIESCYESGVVEVLIPQDRAQPVRVLQDTRSTSKSFDAD